MSFVSRLRMANMFPINSDLGNARINIPQDNYDEILNQAISRIPFNSGQLMRPNGLTAVANMRNQPTNNLRFGGVFDSGPNPGAEMNARAGQDVRDIYENYKRPLNPQVSGPSNDELYTREYFDRQNKEKLANAALETAKGNAGYKQAQLENQEERLRNEKERINLTGERNKTQAELNQAKFDLTKSKEETKQLETERQKEQSEELLKQHSRDALSVLDEISSASGQTDTEGNSIEQLKPNTEWITGFTGNAPNFLMDLNPKNAAARASINRLKDMLTLDRMQSLRQQSKTGSTGFGSNMNQKEFQTLVSAASKLATLNQSEPAFAKELGRIRTLLRKSAGSDNISQNQDFEVLVDPNGIPRQIPKDKVEEALKRGARRQ